MSVPYNSAVMLTKDDISKWINKMDIFTSKMDQMITEINRLSSKVEALDKQVKSLEGNNYNHNHNQLYAIPTTPRVRVIDDDMINELQDLANKYILTISPRTLAVDVYQGFNKYLKDNNMDIVSRSLAKTLICKAGARIEANSERKMIVVIPKSVYNK